MRINGEWFFCDDEVERPIVRGEILDINGSWIEVHFLLDTGADRTVLSATVLAELNYRTEINNFALAGLGGKTDSVVIQTQIDSLTDAGSKVAFRGTFAAVTDYEALDFSVLGRDITGLFAVIVDRPEVWTHFGISVFCCCVICLQSAALPCICLASCCFATLPLSQRGHRKPERVLTLRFCVFAAWVSQPH